MGSRKADMVVASRTLRKIVTFTKLIAKFLINICRGGGKWFAPGGGGAFEPLEAGGGFGKGAPVTDLSLNPYLGFLSTPIWGPETAGVM